MKKALLVIDMQNVTVGENHAEYFKYDNSNLIKEVNRVIEINKQNTVVYIRNIMKNNFINKFAPFKAFEGTQEVELVKELSIVSDNVFVKSVGDAFSNGKLCEFLKEKEIEEIEVIGVDGGGCVALTALGAIENGYKVVINTKAIGTIFEKNKEKYFKKLKKLGAEFV